MSYNIRVLIQFVQVTIYQDTTILSMAENNNQSSSAQDNQAAAQEEIKEQPWVVKVNRALVVNGRVVMSGGE